MTISLNDPILNGASELGGKIGYIGALEELDIRATAAKFKLSEAQTQALLVWLEDAEPPPPDTIALLRTVCAKHKIASLEDFEDFCVYRPIGPGSIDSMSFGVNPGNPVNGKHNHLYVSREYSNPDLAEIISRHPQVETLCHGIKPDDLSLGEQLSMLSAYFAGRRVIGSALGEEYPGIERRVDGWISKQIRPRVSDLEGVILFWQTMAAKNCVMLSLEHPMSNLAQIIACHPQAKTLCCNRKPDELPLKEQLRILADHWGSYGIIESALGKKYPKIGMKVDGWLSQQIRPRLSDLEVVARFWQTVAERNDIALNMKHPMPSLAKIIACHPQAKALCGGRNPVTVPLNEQLKILTQYCGGYKAFHLGNWLVRGSQPRMGKLTSVAEFWQGVIAQESAFLSMEHPMPSLAKIIARHPQAKALCCGRSPSKVPLNEQLKILSNCCGGCGVIDKALGANHPSIGQRMAQWLSSNYRPRMDDLTAVAKLWSGRLSQSPGLKEKFNSSVHSSSRLAI